MQCNIHSCLRSGEWALIISMMPGGSQTSTPTLSKFNHGIVFFFFFFFFFLGGGGVCLVSQCIILA